MEGLDFPSGSNWGAPQLQAMKFPSQPDVHPLEDLHWDDIGEF